MSDLAADSGAQCPNGADVPLSKFDSPSSVRFAVWPVVVSPVFECSWCRVLWDCRLHSAVAGLKSIFFFESSSNSKFDFPVSQGINYGQLRTEATAY